MNGLETLLVAVAMLGSTASGDPPSDSAECLALNMYYEARNQGCVGKGCKGCASFNGGVEPAHSEMKYTGVLHFGVRGFHSTVE